MQRRGKGMPIYEYQCQACGHKLDAIQSFSDKPLKKCPECGKPKLNKLISAPAFHLKGTGWYATDFKEQAKDKPKKVSSDDSKGDTKPEKAGSEPKAKKDKKE